MKCEIIQDAMVAGVQHILSTSRACKHACMLKRAFVLDAGWLGGAAHPWHVASMHAKVDFVQV
eukprot:1137068-Pelagomonas_calceolata.AAC.3